MSANDDLVKACDAKDLKGAQAALAAGASPDARDARGMSVLNTAIVLKHKGLAKALIEAGADVDATDKNGRAALHWLAEELAEADLAALCIARGAKVDRRDTEKYSGRTALHRAVQRPKLDFAKALIAGGANLEVEDDDGNTPLLSLCKSESGDMSKTELANARWLIEQGADLAHVNHDEESALHLAAASSREMMVELLDRGVKVTLTKWKSTPLYYCLSTNDKDTVRWDRLIAAGCAIDHRNDSGRTPLHEAQCSWNVAGVKYLLARGADPSVEDDEGESPLASATRLKQDKILALFAGATKAVAKPAAKPKAAAPAKKAAVKPPAKKPVKKPAKKR